MTMPRFRREELQTAIRARLSDGDGSWLALHRQFPEISRSTLWRNISEVRSNFAAPTADVSAAAEAEDDKSEVARLVRQYDGMGRRILEERGLLMKRGDQGTPAMLDGHIGLRQEMIALGLQVQQLVKARPRMQRLFKVILAETEGLDERSKGRLHAAMQTFALELDWEWEPPHKDSA